MLAEETFWDLFRSLGHWYFELFLILLFDVIIGYLGFKVFWPRVKAHFHEDLEHVGHGHNPDVEHNGGTKQLPSLNERVLELEKAIDVAIYHLDVADDPEAAWQVLVNTLEGE